MKDAIPCELIFEVKKSAEGGYLARARGESIFAEAENWGSLSAEVLDAVACHFDDGERPAIVRLLLASTVLH
jgi:hypothetical protein